MKRVGLIILGIVIVIQFIPVKHTNPPVTEEMPAPDSVRTVLKTACYNCHSNKTEWPWYSYVAPVSWLVKHDVSEAREHMNLSTWDQYDRNDQQDFVEHIWKMVDKGDMPLWYYQIMHPESKLSAQQKQVLHHWSVTRTSQVE